GVNVTRERSVALVLSAFFVGVGGSLYAHLLGAISPSAFYLELTFSTLAMLVVGGMTSLSGAVIGTVAIFALKEVLRHVERGLTLGPVHIPARPGLQLVGVGVVTLLILALRPSGITRGREIGLGSLRRIGSGRPRGGENVPEEGSLAASE
ncbi:MAG: branched-chain amino acid ABC transporter permease, partial [Actinobacteria bacterium]|nr:branched-chain amino acid ABC transporter permease [Actinomycetota bacterium]